MASRPEVLGMTGRFDPLHAPLPLARGLMGILGAIIEIAMLAMFHTGGRWLLSAPLFHGPFPQRGSCANGMK
jgi:hypothetical protein